MSYGYLFDACSLLLRDRMGVDLDRRGGGKKLGEIEGRETVFQLYYMRKVCLIKWIKGIHAYCGTMSISMDTLTWERENLPGSNPRQRTIGNY